VVGVEIIFFGPARDAAGAPSVILPYSPELTLGQVIDALMQRYPKLKVGRAFLRFAVNGEFADPELRINSTDEIAVIPPVSGGQSDLELIELLGEPIDVASVRRFVSADPTLGGIVTFEGATRFERHAQHGALVRLDYEAYAEMALAQMRRIAAEARAIWPIGRLAMVHRTGEVAPGVASVMIAVACPHRHEAFEACRWLIDTLKKVVPLWKREVWEDGSSHWVDPTHLETTHGQDK
jgi:molybdopterin synthase catalytic subunit